jgi:hypothetical protein
MGTLGFTIFCVVVVFLVPLIYVPCFEEDTDDEFEEQHRYARVKGTTKVNID